MSYECQSPLSIEKGFGSLVVRVARSFEMPDVGAENHYRLFTAESVLLWDYNFFPEL